MKNELRWRSDGEEFAEEIRKPARRVELDLFPEKSSKVYQHAYRNFPDFCDKKKVKNTEGLFNVEGPNLNIALFLIGLKMYPKKSQVASISKICEKIGTNGSNSSFPVSTSVTSTINVNF